MIGRCTNTCGNTLWSVVVVVVEMVFPMDHRFPGLLVQVPLGRLR